MNAIFLVLFLGIWLAIAIYVIRGLFTKRGRDAFASRMLYGATIVQDYGELEINKIQFGNQKLRVLKCEKDGEQFMVLEVRDTRRLAIAANMQVTYVRLDKQLLDSLNNFLDSS